MKAYWDSSALVEVHLNADLYARLKREGAFTRTHSLSEVFSSLTGKLPIRVDASQAARSIEDLAKHLDFVDLTPQEVIKALHKGRGLGVRGGRVHDYLHALAAEKSGAKTLLTLDKDDFNGLVPALIVEQV